MSWGAVPSAVPTARHVDHFFQGIDERQRQGVNHYLVALSRVANKLVRGMYAVLKGQRTCTLYYHERHTPAEVEST
jgi:hypothetical protein